MKRKLSLLSLSAAFAILATSAASAQVSVTGEAGADANGIPPFETISAAVAYAVANEEDTVTLDTNDELDAWGAELEDFAWPVGLFTIVAGDGFSPIVVGDGVLLDVDSIDATVRLEGFEIRNHTVLNATLLGVSGNVELVGMTLDNSGARGAADEGVGAGFALASNSVYNSGVSHVPGSTLLVEDSFVLGTSGVTTGNGHDHYVFRNSHFKAEQPAIDYNYAGQFTSRLPGGITIEAEQCIFESDTTVGIFTVLAGDPPGLIESASFENTMFLIGTPRGNNGGMLISTVPSEELSFVHCTFRVEAFTESTTNAFGVLTLAGNITPTMPLHVSNSLFDSPHLGRAGIYAHATTFTSAGLSGNKNTYNMNANTGFRVRTTFPGPWEETAFTSGVVIDTENPDPFMTDADGSLRLAHPQVDAMVRTQADDLVPPVTVDYEGDARPGGGLNDIGADQTETPASVPELTITQSTLNLTEGDSTTTASVALVTDSVYEDGDLVVTISDDGGYTGALSVENIGGEVIVTVDAPCGTAAQSYTVTIEVANTTEASDSDTIDIVVAANSAPTIGSYANITVPLDSTDTATPDAAPADANDNIDTVEVSPETLTGGGTVSVDPVTGVVTISTTPDTEADTYNITVTVTDLCGEEAVSSFALTVPTSVADWMQLTD